MTLLVLFDVDGTLLLSHDEVYAEANRAALLEVYGQAPDAPDVPGETAGELTRSTLRAAGLTDEEIDDGLERWCTMFSRQYVALLAQSDTSAWRVAPGATDALSRIDRHALMTGNPEPVARARMERIGLAEFFPEGEGAFGCEREHRVELYELALARAGDWPAARSVAVGDTPRDIATARRAGGRCVAVTTGSYDADALAAADRVIATLADLPDVLASLD